MAKATQVSQFQKARLKMKMLRSISDANIPQPVPPEGLSQTLSDSVGSTMIKYDGEFKKLLTDLTGDLDTLNPQTGLIFKTNDTTSDQYYRSLLSAINNKKEVLLTKQRAAIDAIDMKFSEQIRNTQDSQVKTQLEQQREIAVKKLNETYTQHVAFFDKQREFLVEEQKKFAKDTKANDLSPFFDLLSQNNDKGIKDLTRAQRTALMNPDGTVQDFVYSLLDISDPERKKKTLNSTLNIDTANGTFDFNINYFADSKNIEAIEQLYAVDWKTGEIKAPKFEEFPKSELDAYRDGFPSRIWHRFLSDKNFSFNNALFAFIRGLIVRPIIDDMNNKFALKDREVQLSTDPAMKEFMTKAAEHVPPINTPEELQKFLEKYTEQTGKDPVPGLKFSTHGVGKGDEYSDTAKNWIDNDIRDHLKEHEWTKNGSMMNVFNIHKAMYQKKMVNEEVLKVTGDKPGARAQVDEEPPPIRVFGRNSSP